MRQTLYLLLVSGACGCAVASGEVTGGTPLFETQSASADAAGVSGASTFTALYNDYFGPMGKANCTSLSTCHNSASAQGAGTSGFVCGTSKDECWQGMTKG